MTRSGLEGQYLDWLCERVESHKAHVRCERELLEVLYGKDFHPLIPNDDNREADGIALRECFGLETDRVGIEDRMGWPCTLLEMLIALAERMDYILNDLSRSNRTAKWFWLIVGNLKLEEYCPEDQNADDIMRRNNRKLRKFLNRKYDYDGNGGLFPLDNPDKDQRNVELWYQMQEYVMEELI